MSLQSCPTLCDPIDGSPPGSPVPGILQAKNTGVGCHFLLQCMKMKSESEVAQPCPTLSDPIDCSLPGSSVRGILQARILEWVAIPFSRGSSLPRDRTWVSCVAGRVFTNRKVAAAAAAMSLQSCPTLCDPIDGSPPGSAVPGILQARKNTGVGCHF